MYYPIHPRRAGQKLSIGGQRKPFSGKHLQRRDPARRDVTPLIPTTYDDKKGVLYNSCGGKGLWRAKNEIIGENRADSVPKSRK